MADRINVVGAASALNTINNDFTRINREITSMLDNLKYLQDNMHDLANYPCTSAYEDIARSIYASNGLIDILKKVHKWCDKVDNFVEEEEHRIADDNRIAEEERVARLKATAIKKGNS